MGWSAFLIHVNYLEFCICFLWRWQNEEKIAAVTAVWKQKYEELIIEKVELDSVIRDLNSKMTQDLRMAQEEVDTAVSKSNQL